MWLFKKIMYMEIRIPFIKSYWNIACLWVLNWIWIEFSNLFNVSSLHNSNFLLLVLLS